MATTLINQLVENMVESLVEEVTKRVLIHFDTLSLRLQVLEKAAPADGTVEARVERLEQQVRGIQEDFTYDVNAIIKTRFYDDDIPDEGRVVDLIKRHGVDEGVSIEDVIELINDRVRIVVE